MRMPAPRVLSKTLIEHALQIAVKLFMALGLEVRRYGRGSSSIFQELRSNILKISPGVLHIGAHTGQEADLYDAANCQVLWIEALPETFNRLEVSIARFKKQKAVNALLGDAERSVEFNISENDAHSSSIFQFSRNSKFGLKMKNSLKLKMVRLDAIISEEEIQQYPHWVLDVQGAELLVLQGAVKSLKHCQTLDVEVSTFETYEGGAQLDDIEKFLESAGFIPVWKFAKNSHGNLLFIRAINPKTES